MTRLLICGSRDFADIEMVAATLRTFVRRYGTPSIVITGGARGADTFGAQWAKTQGIESLVYPADWTRYGRRAGFMRNTQMLTQGKPTHVIAFYSGRKTPGTAMMVNIARRAGVPTCELGLNKEQQS